MAAMIPEDLAAALGYDQLGDAAGYITATVYGLLGPALLLVFAIGPGPGCSPGSRRTARLELELTHPVARHTVYVERLLGLWASAAAARARHRPRHHRAAGGRARHRRDARRVWPGTLGLLL
jgi:hypothetical protein